MNVNKSNNEKCRLCLTEYDKNDLTSIFTDAENVGISLASRIMICLSLPVQAKDSYSKFVCKICENRITQFYVFRENCSNSYYSLLDRTSFYNEVENYEEIYSNSDVELKILQSEESRTEQNIPEDFVVCMENRFVENENDKGFAPDENFESNFERLSPESTRDSAGKIISVATESDLLSGDEKLSHETDIKEDAEENVKYKYLRCGNLFSDSNAASNDEEIAESRTEMVEYLEENLERRVSNRGIISEKEESCGEELLSDETCKRVNKPRVRNLKKSRRKSCAFVEKRKWTEGKLGHFCQECGSVFSSAALLKRHSVVHTGLRPHECPICHKRFSQIGQLNFHKKFHENPRHRCEICKKPFLRPSDISKHMRTHTGEKPFDCNVCSKSFAQLVGLQQHQRIHTGDKPYVCEICGKQFSQKANKEKHFKIHKEGAKPHTCSICGRSFSEIEEMKLHRDGHGGGKPRKCSYCEESFRKLSELTRHTRRYHTFEKPYKCAFCQKAFYCSYTLKQHVLVHTGQKPYACTSCGLRFTQKGNLVKHCEKKHGTRSVDNEKRSIPKVKTICTAVKEKEIFKLANDLLKDKDETLIIEEQEEEEENEAAE